MKTCVVTELFSSSKCILYIDPILMYFKFYDKIFFFLTKLWMKKRVWGCVRRISYFFYVLSRFWTLPKPVHTIKLIIILNLFDLNNYVLWVLAWAKHLCRLYIFPLQNLRVEYFFVTSLMMPSKEETIGTHATDGIASLRSRWTGPGNSRINV